MRPDLAVVVIYQRAKIRKFLFIDRQHQCPEDERMGTHSVELLKVALCQGPALFFGETVAAGPLSFVEPGPLFLLPVGDVGDRILYIRLECRLGGGRDPDRSSGCLR